MGRIRSLLGDDAAPAVDAWLERLRDLARARTAAKVQLQGLLATLGGYVKDLGTFDEPQLIKEQFSQAGEQFFPFSESLARYGEAEQALVQS